MTARLIATLLAATLSTPVWADPSRLQPGLWEITTEMAMPGVPMKLPTQTTRHCHTAEELAQVGSALPSSGDAECRIADYRVEGATATWRMQCSGATPMRGTASMTSSATSYTGEMHGTMQGPAGDMQISTRWRAARVGDCP